MCYLCSPMPSDKTPPACAAHRHLPCIQTSAQRAGAVPGLRACSSSSGGLAASCPTTCRWSGKHLDLSSVPAHVSSGDGAELICFMFVLFPAAAPLHLRRRLLFLTN